MSRYRSNRYEKNYEQWMEGKLAEVRGIIRDYIRMPNIKRVTVIEMGQLITPTPGLSAYLQDEEVWGEDPVHLTPKGWTRDPNIREESRGEGGRTHKLAGSRQEAKAGPQQETP